MKDETKAILTLIVILMYAIGIILFFINLFNDSMGNAYFLRVKIFCGLMVGATILGGIVKASGSNENDT
jgi:hypothetical protein